MDYTQVYGHCEQREIKKEKKEKSAFKKFLKNSINRDTSAKADTDPKR